MYQVTPEKMVKIKVVVGKGLEAQEAVFNALDFNPYDNDDIGSLDSVVMERERYESERKERVDYPLDYGICETEERAKEIKAGAALSEAEEQALNENIFDGDDTLMVITELSDGTEKVLAVTAQQIWGQGGLHVIDFLGLFANYEDARKAIDAADYVTFDES